MTTLMEPIRFYSRKSRTQALDTTEPQCLGTRPHSEEEETPPPRLCHQDLQHPEDFHQRLTEWLMKQR